MKPAVTKIKTALVPIGAGEIGNSALSIAQAIALEIILVGVVTIPEGEPVSAGAVIATPGSQEINVLS